METDASNQGIAGILSQSHVVNGFKQLHPVDYYPTTLSATQRNWPMHDNELFTIVYQFQKWREWLVGVHVNLHTVHSELQYLKTKQKLNFQQASWYRYMLEFIYYIYRKPGFQLGIPDGLSRCSGEEKSGMDTDFLNKEQLTDLEHNDIRAEEDAEDVEIEGIDVVTWEKKNRL